LIDTSSAANLSTAVKGADSGTLTLSTIAASQSIGWYEREGGREYHRYVHAVRQLGIRRERDLERDLLYISPTWQWIRSMSAS